MGYRMKGFSGFGNSPAKQQDALEKKIVSEEVDVTKDENKLDGDKTSSKNDVIKSPDKEKTSPLDQKTRREGGGYTWVDKPTKEHTMDRYEGTTYLKGKEYRGGLEEKTHQVTGEKTYTKYKPTRKYTRTKEGSKNVKSKEISEKRYKRIKKRKSKRYKEE